MLNSGKKIRALRDKKKFKSRRGKNKTLTALKSNSNTVWFNFQTYIYIYKLYINRQHYIPCLIAE
jgi:hypothetical protein